MTKAELECDIDQLCDGLRAEIEGGGAHNGHNVGVIQGRGRDVLPLN